MPPIFGGGKFYTLSKGVLCLCNATKVCFPKRVSPSRNMEVVTIIGMIGKKSDKTDGEEDEAMILGIQVKTQPKSKSSKTAAAANLSTVLAGKWQNV